VRVPIRSPSRPAVMTRTASTRAYAFSTHSTSSRDACSLSIMFGIAMLTIVRSSNVMKNPSDTTTRIAHGLPRSLVMVQTIAHLRPANKIYLNLNKRRDSRLDPGTRAPSRGRPGRDGYAPGMDLNGTAAIVSGGASGLGEATARALAAAGATVVIA